MVRALTEVILPVVLVAGLGAVLGRRFVIDQSTLNKVQLYGLVPALLFDSIMKSTVPAGQVALLALGYGGASLGIGLLAWLATTWLPPRNRGGVIACAVLGNNGNFGLPIALLALGQAGLEQGIVIFMFSMVLMWTIGPVLLGSPGGVRESLRVILRLPMLWAMAAALAFRLAGWTLPVGINSAVELVAGAAVPVILIALGVQLSRPGAVRLGPAVLTGTGLRVLVLPVLAWGVGRLIGLSGLPLQSLVLACAMPTAVNVAMLALEYSDDADTVASEVALSTFASIPVIAVVVSLLPLIG